MATIEFLNKRIEGANKNLSKLEAKLSRIRKVEAQGWADPNPYYYSANDLKWCLRDIEEAKANIAKYTAELEEATMKANSRNCKPILDFLQWREERLTEWYMEAMTAHHLMSDRLKAMYDSKSCKQSPEYEALFEEFKVNTYGKYEMQSKPYYNYKRELKGYHMERVKVEDGCWEYADRYLHDNYEDAKALLAKDLKQESEAMYDDLIERITDITGEITDASLLTVNPKGGIDGYVTGKKARAEVHTIGAGGYAVQCFHFRTLVHKCK